VAGAFLLALHPDRRSIGLSEAMLQRAAERGIPIGKWHAMTVVARRLAATEQAS
jgi:hypothetical protein